MDIVDKLASLITKPGLMDVICTNVASGGSLIEMCKRWEVNYGKLFEWINSLPDGNKRITQAIIARDNYLKELVVNELIKTVSQQASDDTGSKMRHSSKNKALEMLGKTVGMFAEKHEHSGSLNLEQLVAGSRKDG